MTMSPQTETDPVKPRRVLIVEDEPRLRDVLVRGVQSMDYEPTAVRSAEQALTQLAETHFAIALVDLNLPGMSGLDLIDQMIQRDLPTAAVILTGYGDLPAAQKAMRLHVVDFLTKPCPMDELEQALSRAQQRYRDQVEMADEQAAEKFATSEEDDTQPDAHRTLADIERDHIFAALARHDGNREKAAAELGISLRTLYYRLSKYEF